MHRQLEQAGLRVLHSQLLPVVMGPRKLHSQLSVCTQYLDELDDSDLDGLARAMRERVSQLTRRIDVNDELAAGLCFGADYLIEAALADP